MDLACCPKHSDCLVNGGCNTAWGGVQCKSSGFRGLGSNPGSPTYKKGQLTQQCFTSPRLHFISGIIIPPLIGLFRRLNELDTHDVLGMLSGTINIPYIQLPLLLFFPDNAKLLLSEFFFPDTVFMPDKPN